MYKISNEKLREARLAAMTAWDATTAWAATAAYWASAARAAWAATAAWSASPEEEEKQYQVNYLIEKLRSKR